MLINQIQYNRIVYIEIKKNTVFEVSNNDEEILV